MKVQIISYCLPCTISTPIFPNFQVMHVTPICNTAPKHCCLRAPVRIPRLKSPIIKLDFNFCSHLPNTVCSIFKSSSDFFFFFSNKLYNTFFFIQKREWKITKSILFHFEYQILYYAKGSDVATKDDNLYYNLKP